MATHDYVIANQSGAAFRTDLNNALSAIVSNNSSSSEPATKYAYQWWADTTNGVLKIRNSANDGWVELLQLDGTLTLEDGSASTPGLAFRDDLNTGIFSSAADTFNVATAGVERMELGATTIFNEDGADVDFRIEGDTEANLFYVDAGNDRIGIGTSSPEVLLHATGSSGTISITVENTSNSAREAAINLKGKHSNGTVRQLMFKYDSNDIFRITTAGSLPIAFETADAERFRIDGNGKLLIGHTSARSVAGGNSKVQVESNDSTGRISIVQNRNEASGAPFLSLGKSRGTSVGASTIVQDDDTVGTIAFAGADGTDFPSLAQIVASVDGTPGNNDMPGRLCFHTTADGSQTPTEHVRIDSGGQITMPYYGDGNYTVGVRLYVSYIYDSTANVANAITIASRPDALVTKHIRFWYTLHGSGGGSELGSITSNNAGSVSYNTSSDYRLKENATAISDGITRLKTLKPYRFNFIDIPDTTLDGFFAHECTAVPESITGTKDAVTPDGKIDPQSIDQSKLVPLITAALQEAISKIEVLETKVAALESA